MRRWGLLAIVIVGGSLAAMLLPRTATSTPSAEPTGPPVVTVSPLWIAPPSLKALITKSDAVVEAHVTAVRPGEPIVQPPVKGVPDGAIADIPTSRVDVTVDKVVRGDVPDTVTLFQTGGQTTIRGTQSTVVAEGDPAFSAGERYVLFLQRRPDGTYLYYGPNGRLGVDDANLMHAVDGTGLLAPLDGLSRSDLETKLQEETK